MPCVIAWHFALIKMREWGEMQLIKGVVEYM